MRFVFILACLLASFAHADVEVANKAAQSKPEKPITASLDTLKNEYKEISHNKIKLENLEVKYLELESKYIDLSTVMQFT